MRKLIALLLLIISIPALAAPKTYQTRSYPFQPHAKGLVRTEDSKRRLKTMKRTGGMKSFSVTEIPGSIDLSPLVALPDAQGECGSCWSFALTKALRSEYMIAGLDPGVLEYNYLLSNCGPGPRQYGCQGGDFPAAQSFENSAGPGLNAQNPYQGYPMRCLNLPVKGTAVSALMLGGASGPTFKDLATAVSQNHMVVVDVAAGTGDWEHYAGGVYNDCHPGELDHMLTLVSYTCGKSVDAKGNCVFDSTGRAVNHDELLLLENQWTEDWGTKAPNGHGGYMWTKMFDANGEKCNGVASDALIFEIKVPPRPPVPSPTPSVSPSVTPSPAPSPAGQSLLCRLLYGLCVYLGCK